MKYLYAIVEDMGGSLHTLTSTGSSRGINEDLLYSNSNWSDFNDTFKPSEDMLFMAAVIITRHRDTNWASNESNKLYNALAKYRYFMIGYEQEREVEERDVIDMKPFEVEETVFYGSLFSSESCSIIKKAATLTKRVEREEVYVDITTSEDHWCYTTDSCPRYTGTNSLTMKLPLSVDTKTVQGYISGVLGKTYSFGLRIGE